MPNIKVIEYEESEGRLREVYDDIIKTRGKLAEVHKIQSLRPESIVKHMDLYMEVMFGRSELSRADREMIAVVVSSANSCEYCQIHHAVALNHYWKNDSKVNQIRLNYTRAELTDKQRELCNYASVLTKNPEITNQKKLTTDLVKVGWSDSAILDATLVISYFNFVNRVVMSLGVVPNQDEVEGYKY